MDDSKRITSLEQENKKLQKEVKDLVRACKLLESKMRVIDKRANQAYSVARDALGKTNQINDTLRRSASRRNI